VTEYLIAARAVIIFWTNLVLTPTEIVFNAIEADWNAVASNFSVKSLR
jgi:hypothetical protein